VIQFPPFQYAFRMERGVFARSEDEGVRLIMNIAFIVNPAAGTGFAVQVMSSLEKILLDRHISYQVMMTERPGYAKELASSLAGEENISAVVSVGGDGTAGEVASGLSGTTKPMGIIPAGTGNDFIKTVGIPNDPEKALELILTGNPVPTDTGLVNEQFFLNVCGTGFDVTVLDYAEAEKKKHRGLLPYFLGLIKAIFHYRSVKLKIQTDDHDEEGEYLVCSIANGRFIGGGIPICPKASTDDGLLNLVLIANVHRWQIPFYLPGLMLSRSLHFHITRHFLVHQVHISGDQLRINIDGEIVSLSDAVFRINPASLQLIRP